MLLTEAEAATKQCRVIPAAMIPAGRLAGGGDQVNYGYGNCVGSKCMLWVWSHGGGSGNGGWVGYCGAAGSAGAEGPRLTTTVMNIKPAAA